jgi:hypothetical protein
MSIQIYERPHNGPRSRYYLDQQRKPFSGKRIFAGIRIVNRTSIVKSCAWLFDLL